MQTFSYRMLSASELELNITGVIGDGWDENAVTAKAVRKVLAENKNAKRIVVNIDSSGGSFFEGLAIYQMLQEHPATVDVVVGARSASAATVAQMSGDTIVMHETSTMLIHPVWTVAIGNADELRKVADDLDMLTESSVKAYAARTGMDPDDVRSLMAEDRYMDADEALKLGLCTEIRKAKTKPSKPKAMTEQEIRSEIETMRSKATASAAALRVAAMAPQQPSNPPAPVPAETEKHENMAQLAVILAALCLAEGATDNEAVASINGLKSAKDANAKILAALDVDSLDKAVGAIEAFKASAERATKAEAELKALRDETAKAKHSSLVAAALDPNSSSPHAGKLTPAQKAWAESVTTETLEGFLAVAPAVLKGDGKREPKASGCAPKQPKAADQAPTWNGKTYAQLNNKERLALGEQDEDLFNEMRNHAIENRLI